MDQYLDANTNTFEANKGTGGAQHVFEQSATGFEPSINRVVVEQSNNGTVSLLKTGAVTAPGVKASPGFLKGVTVTGNGAVPAGTCLIIYDSLTAAAPILDVIKVPTSAEKTVWVDEDVLFVTGLSFGLGTYDADGTLTAVTVITPALYSVLVGSAYR